jgi:4-amino-4-deoxy-L-arabinose transferase-like glycosyltransferase
MLKSLDKYGIILLLFTILFLHVVVISFPSHDTVFDEVYYLQSARDSNQLNATNLEHMPLSKIMYGISILAFGDSAIGWRIIPVFCSVLSVLFIYLIAKKFVSVKKALLVSFLLSFETLFFVNTSIAILEAPMILFSLIGLYFFFNKNYKLSSLQFGIAFLCKETAILLPIAILIFKFIHFEKSYLKKFAVVAIIFTVTVVGSLAVYDVVYHPILPSGRVLTNPAENFMYMLSYFDSKTQRDWSEVAVHRPAWTWTLPFPETFKPPMYRDVTIYHLVSAGNDGAVIISREEIFFKVQWYSMQSLPIAFMYLPLIAVCLWNIKRKVKESYSLFSLTWLLSSYVPWLFLGNHLLFNYYFVLTVPAICFSMPLLWDSIPNRKLKLAFVAVQCILVLISFVYYFPINLLRG